MSNQRPVWTVARLKEIIKDWPEINQDGEPTEVWLETGKGLSSPCVLIYELNVRTKANAGPVGDLLLCPDAEAWAKDGRR